MDSSTTNGESRFVSNWVKANRPAYRQCCENGCKGKIYYCRSYWQGDADWAVYQCDICGAGFEQAGCWTYPIKPQI